MLQIDPSPKRAELGFRESVLANFRFLGDLGFHPVQEEVTLVRHESPTVFVNIYHGRASFELGVEIGGLREPSEKVTLYDIVAWAGALDAEGFGQHVMFQVSSREGVQQFVPRLANLVQRYGTPFLMGDATAYTGVLEARSRAATDYERQVHLDDLRRRAEAAWNSKDFTQVVKLYASMKSEMTEVEAKRLAYAEKHVLATDNISLDTSTKL
jgi:hypothetical protein